MNNQNEKETFSYTYSAKQQDEIKRIRSKYMETEENKLEQVRKMDEAVTLKATMISITVGIMGTLIMGIGMCCTLVWAETLFIPGIFIGIVGIVLVICAYPIYIRALKRERKKIAPEILRLTEELLK